MNRQHQETRDRVRREILANPQRSNKALSRLIGISNATVVDVRKACEASAAIHHFFFKSRGSAGSVVKHSAECWCGEGDKTPPLSPAEKLAQEERSVSDIDWDAALERLHKMLAEIYGDSAA